MWLTCVSDLGSRKKQPGMDRRKKPGLDAPGLEIWVTRGDLRRRTNLALRICRVDQNNDSRTTQVIENVFGDRVWFRTKDVRGPEPPPSGWWDTDFAHHMPHTYTWVEGLEIDPVVSNHRGELGTDYSDPLIKAFGEKSIPFYRIGSVFRIQGYTRSMP